MENELAKIISRKARENLALLKKAGVLKNFYLAGGTGAALILGHRLSLDFDFFSPKPFKENLLLKKLAGLGKFTLEKKEAGTLVGSFSGTKLSFFLYPYPLLRKPKTIFGIEVAGLADIAAMKIDAVSGRGSKKDFIDLFKIIQSGHSLEKLLGLFKRKYRGIRYNMLHILKGLVYFAEAEKEKMPRMLKQLSWEEVKIFFQKEARKLKL